MAGKLFRLGEETPYRHPKVWARETTSGPDRLRIGPGKRPVALLRKLAAVLAEPLFVLVVLHTPRMGDAGRLESHPLTLSEILPFLKQFRDLFENDGRAQLWIGEAQGQGLVVLDEDDLIFAYGPLSAFQQLLQARAFSPGEAFPPAPHEHYFNAEFDALELRLRDWTYWQRELPLAEDDLK